MQIEGTHTTADVKTDEVDDHCINQIREMVDHEAFRNQVRIMPDAHGGAGAVIGFTMHLGERICPNTVGVDIGCGMTAFQLGDPNINPDDEDAMAALDRRIRDAVPMGRKTFGDDGHEKQDYHLINDFPWETCEDKLASLNDHWDGGEIESPDYGGEYFKSLCRRVEYDPKRAIDSLGSLGGGNHFIEISRSEQTGDYWAVVHSGSRGIGLSIAQYWQEQAHRACDDRAETLREELADIDSRYYRFDLDDVSDAELLDWVLGGMGEDWKNMDAIVQDHRESNPQRIEEIKNELRDLSIYAQENVDGDDLDYLEGEARHGYLVDMVFAQTYAEESRRLMASAVADAAGATVEDRINSTHNYIDFEDLVIRKGATRVHDGERGIIPFNMADGAIIVRGKGNDDWNQSAPHGAGRRGSRRWAYDTFDLEDFKSQMEGVFSTSVTEETLDEIPTAYKDPDVVLERLGETAEITDTLTPVMNLKAEE